MYVSNLSHRHPANLANGPNRCKKDELNRTLLLRRVREHILLDNIYLLDNIRYILSSV